MRRGRGTELRNATGTVTILTAAALRTLPRNQRSSEVLSLTRATAAPPKQGQVLPPRHSPRIYGTPTVGTFFPLSLKWSSHRDSAIKSASRLPRKVSALCSVSKYLLNRRMKNLHEKANKHILSSLPPPLGGGGMVSTYFSAQARGEFKSRLAHTCLAISCEVAICQTATAIPKITGWTFGQAQSVLCYEENTHTYTHTPNFME